MSIFLPTRHTIATPARFLLIATALVLSSGPAHADRWLGVMIDGGLPDGASASLVYHPIPQLRLNLGASHNLISPGLKAGATWVPFDWTIAPTLTLETGHAFAGDANPLARMLSGNSQLALEALDSFYYDYISSHLGIEMRYGRFTMYMHGGASWLQTTLRNLDSLFSVPKDNAAPALDIRSVPRMQIWSPSVRLGVIVYL